jgi:hypothetical protein
MSGNSVQGRNVRERNVRGRNVRDVTYGGSNVRGRIIPVPLLTGWPENVQLVVGCWATCHWLVKLCSWLLTGWYDDVYPPPPSLLDNYKKA